MVPRAAAFTLGLLLALPFAAFAGGQQEPGGRSTPVGPPRTSVPAPPLARIIWLEDVPGREGVCRRIDPSDARLKNYERWIDTEAGRFARRLVYRAATRFGVDPAFHEPVLPVVIRKGGNNGAYGLTIETAAGVEEHGQLPYIILDPSPQYLGDTLLHESGHVVNSLALRARHAGSRWSAFPHTTFAVSDPITALAEGYAIHFETLWGHFGADANKQAYYRRLAPSFAPGTGRIGSGVVVPEYFSPVVDLMNFAQTWSRYQAVRDGSAAFEGHLYDGGYARSQMDPSRDRARLKSANAMLASEGVAASIFFWTSASLAAEKGALPAAGLDQPAILDAEMALLEGLAALPATDGGTFRPDVLDLVEALKARDAHTGDVALRCFVDMTRGVTARPAIRERWRSLYDAAIMLDRDSTKALIAKMDAERTEIVEQAQRDPLTLRAGVGPVIPLEVRDAAFELKAIGRKMPVEFDLNAMSDPEMALLRALDADGRTRIDRERTRAPFASVADFEKRTGLSIERLGLEPVDVRRGS